MITYKRISATDAKVRLLKEEIKVADTRDRHTFEKDHIQGAFHLTNATVSQFFREVDFNTPVFVICYHGNSSKGGAQYLFEQGYSDVSSVDGGMVEWRLLEPND